MNFFCYVVINAYAFFITFRVWVMVFFFLFLSVHAWLNLCQLLEKS